MRLLLVALVLAGCESAGYAPYVPSDAVATDTAAEVTTDTMDADAICKASYVCQKAGMCSADPAEAGACIVTSDEDCQNCEDCRVMGRCSVGYGPAGASTTRCTNLSDADCEQSDWCKNNGKCKHQPYPPPSLGGGMCVSG